MGLQGSFNSLLHVGRLGSLWICRRVDDDIFCFLHAKLLLRFFPHNVAVAQRSALLLECFIRRIDVIERLLAFVDLQAHILNDAILPNAENS